MNITIIGSGNIAHALIACMRQDSYKELYILTSNPFKSEYIESVGCKGKGKFNIITNNPKDIIPYSDLIIFTIPAHIREKYVKKIAPYIKEGTLIGAFPGIAGFNEEIERNINKNINVFASQRVPYIARIKEKGKLVVTDKKEELFIAVKKDSKKVKGLLENLLDIKVILLDNFLEVNLSNSNPILHSARLYDILINQKLNKEDYFYREWSVESSKILLAMDEEFMQIVKKLNLNIKSLKEHYKVKDEIEMTEKIKSINSFKNIKIPKLKLKDGYILDYTSRYFSEDIGKSLLYIKEYAKRLNIKTPIIDKVYNTLFNTSQANKRFY